MIIHEITLAINMQTNGSASRSWWADNNWWARVCCIKIAELVQTWANCLFVCLLAGIGLRKIREKNKKVNKRRMPDEQMQFDDQTFFIEFGNKIA